ncbi:DUF192 domain-containing protein [Candidatus Pacearchaeota archaeon]|nr:DUF192 domain-containing protein [Candidatus Pacearchaeota archaeon]
MKIALGKRTCDLPVISLSALGKICGLMFRSSTSSSLLFAFSSNIRFSIHSWFVFFPFIAIWLDSKRRVMEWRVVRPFSTLVLPQKPFRYLVEVPCTTRNVYIRQFLDGSKDLNR